MAPRGRHIKKNTRMQAALEAMLAYGFSKDLIKKKLKELLNVYGEENWFFIEENSYKVLLDNILEHVEQQEQQKDDTLAGPSTAILAPHLSDKVALDTALPAIEGAESVLQTFAASDTALVNYESDGNDRLPLPGEGAGQKDINLNQNSGEQKDTKALETSDKKSGAVDPFDSQNPLPPHAILYEQPKHNVLKRKRKPCHGWISNDKEVSEDCLITLEATPLPAEFEKLLFGMNIRSRHKTRWDLRPEDLI